MQGWQTAFQPGVATRVWLTYPRGVQPGSPIDLYFKWGLHDPVGKQFEVNVLDVKLKK